MTTASMTTTTTTTPSHDGLVLVTGAGLVPIRVLRWLHACERFGVRFHLVNNRLEYTSGAFAGVGGLPTPARAFIVAHNDVLRRLALAVPTRLM